MESVGAEGGWMRDEGLLVTWEKGAARCTGGAGGAADWGSCCRLLLERDLLLATISACRCACRAAAAAAAASADCMLAGLRGLSRKWLV